ncbi:MAG: hypothetical protein NVSMB6_27030 [Burkholderiaceae bacterium]
MSTLVRLGLAWCSIGLAAACASAAHAGETDVNDRVASVSPLDVAAVTSDARLATMRGGFDLGTGVLVSFGIERAVYVNGALVTTTGFNVGTLGAVSPGGLPIAGSQALPENKQLSVLSAVQNGTANVLRTEGNTSPALPATVVQNTLNDQTIRAVTTIHAVSTSLNVLKSANVGITLGEAIGASVGPH